MGRTTSPPISALPLIVDKDQRLQSGILIFYIKKMKILISVKNINFGGVASWKTRHRHQN